MIGDHNCHKCPHHKTICHKITERESYIEDICVCPERKHCDECYERTIGKVFQ